MLTVLLGLLQIYGLAEGPLPARAERDGVFVEASADYAAVYLDRVRSEAAWSISCEKDAMNDQRKCSLNHQPFDDGAPLIVYLGNADRRGGVCVVGHDFPRRSATIRIDDRPAISVGESGCTTLASIAPALRSGVKWKSRRYSWPNDYPVDQEISLRGMSVALDLLTELRSRR